MLHSQAEIYLVRSLCKPRRRKTLSFSAFENKLLRRINFTEPATLNSPRLIEAYWSELGLFAAPFFGTDTRTNDGTGV